MSNVIRTFVVFWERKSIFPRVLLIGLAFWSIHPAAGQQLSPLDGYLSFSEIEHRLQEMAGRPGVELTSLGKTLKDRDIWLLTIGAPEEGTTKPAILILGNVHASHLLGCELAWRMAERLTSDTEPSQDVQRLLERFRVYIIPVPSPDASEKNFRRPYREVAGNGTPTDDDRDFSVGEDPPVDLNEDGWITMMRVHDPLGTHRTHPADSRVLIEIDRSKNETAGFRLYLESRDADRDQRFGEDASDGVNFNRNFTFNYPYFGPGAGPHQVSENETRAIADFAFDHPEIGVVFCFSPEDNLFHPWKGSAQTDQARIKTKILTGDATYTDFLCKQFQELHGGQNASQSPAGQGSFSEWAYFHFGRWSFASRGWWIPSVDKEEHQAERVDDDCSEAPSNEGHEQQESANADAGDDESQHPSDSVDDLTGEALPRSDVSPALQPQDQKDKRGEDDLKALAWFEANDIAGFVDWQPIEHADFPGQIVEVGGFKPFYRFNPPADQIDALVQPHLSFLTSIEAVWPTLKIEELTANELVPGTYDVKCQIVNTGFLPTMPEMGRINREWYPIQVTLAVPDRAKWISGSRRQRVNRLDGQGGSSELRWLFQLDEPLPVGTTLTISTWSPTLHPLNADVAIESNMEAKDEK